MNTVPWHGKPVYIIAEASGNHSQSIMRAHNLVQAAANAGAHAVKFQTFTPQEIAADGVVIPRGHNADHDAWLDKHQATTLRQLFASGGLPRPWHKELQRHARDCGLDFLSTPFSVSAARFLAEEIGVPALKIASGDITFSPLLSYADTCGLPVILSTGGATAGEVTLAAQYLEQAYHTRRLALLHCRSVYPCAIPDANLRAIQWLALSFPLATPGWSDHTLSVGLPGYAVACGAVVLEKHLGLDTDGIDAGHSLLPAQFARMVQQVHTVVSMLGAPTKAPLDAEAHDRIWARRDPADWLRPVAAAREGAWA